MFTTVCAPGTSTTRTGQLYCPSPANNNGVAVYCDGSGAMTPCPGGVFGNTGGLASAACTSSCAAGYYCPQGSANATAVPCGGVDW